MRGPVGGGNGGWGMAMDKLMKRRSVRHVELKEGNLTIDIPVPAQILPKGAKGDEMCKMRYTAATVRSFPFYPRTDTWPDQSLPLPLLAHQCDPDDFQRSKYTLRPFLYGRKTELFIVMVRSVSNFVSFVASP